VIDASVLAAASHSYIDIGLTPSAQLDPSAAPYTIDMIPTSDLITLSGVGINGPPVHPLDMGAIDATSLGNGVYRYYVAANTFRVNAEGTVEVSVAAGAVVDSSTNGNTSRATTQSFTVQGTTAHVAGPADGGLVGMASLNNRGFLDVTFGFPAGKALDLDTIYDLDAEFSIDPSAGHSIRLDGSQAPILVSKSGNTYKFRYFTLGSYTSGPVTITLISGAIGFADGGKSTATDTLSVAAPQTANVGYLDIRYQPIAGYVLDADSITDNDTDADAEFDLGGAASSVVLSTTYAPLRLTGSNTFRYFLTGDFATGEVVVSFLANTFYSVIADTSAVTISGICFASPPGR
jgi:hypothetical protein